MNRITISLISTAFVVHAAQASASYTLDEAFCKRYFSTSSSPDPSYHYRVCLKLEGWAKVHPTEKERCLAEGGKSTNPELGYARCLQDARFEERKAEREKCIDDVTKRERIWSPVWITLVTLCEQSTKD